MGQLYEFLCLCFGLFTAPWVLTKLMESSISLLRGFFVRILINLDDILLIATSRKELLLTRDTLLFPPQNLDFLINRKKLILTPTSALELLGIEIDFLKMTLRLPKKIVKKLQTSERTYQRRKQLQSGNRAK